MKTNIFLLGLSSAITKSVAYALSIDLDMFYADVNDLLKFDLIDIARAVDQCGVEYVEKLETKQVRNVANYDNTVFTMSFATFNANKHNPWIKNNSIVVFLDLPKQFCVSSVQDAIHKIDQLLYKDRKLICKEYADIYVKSIDDNEQRIIKDICCKIQQAYAKGVR